MSGVSRETGPFGVQRGVSRTTATRALPSRWISNVLLLPVRFYRRVISPLVGPRCRYYPSCSSYAEQALRELGPFRGTIVAAWRVLRCNPLSSGGLDPLENRRLFRSTTTDELTETETTH